MGVLEQLLGGLMGGSGGSSPLQSAVASLLGGSQGLGGLVQSFEQAGLGHIAQSWVANGPNQPVSADQLHSVFGQQQVQGMASQAGMEPQDFLAQLSQHLPNLVNSMTPQGRVPEDGTINV